MNKPITDALRLYESEGVDFAELLKWHLGNGVVVSLPTCFLLAYFCKRGDIQTSVSIQDADCVFITICVGDMREAGRQIVEIVPFIAYQRFFKKDERVRIKDFKKFYEKTKWGAYSVNQKPSKSQK